MAIRWDIARKVRVFLRDECRDEERRAFGDRLHAVVHAPIQNLEFHHDPRISRYVLGFFRFGSNLAICEYYIADELLYVRECQKPARKSVGRTPPQRGP